MKKSFEQQIKESLDSFEVRQSPSGWDEMSALLDKQQPVSKNTASKKLGKGLLSVAIVAAIVFSIYKMSFKEGKLAKEVVTTISSGNKRTKNKVFNKEVVDNPNKDLRTTVNNNAVDMTNASDPREALNLQKLPKEKGEIELNENLDKADLVAVQPKEPNLLNTTNKENENQSAKVLENLSTASIGVSKSKVCEGLNIIFTANEQLCVDCSFTWDFGDGNIKRGKLVNYKYENAGLYNVQLTAYKDGSSFTDTKNIEILRTPLVDFQTRVIYDNDMPKYEFDYPYRDNKTVLWMFEDGSQYTTAKFTKGFYQKGNTSVKLEVTNLNGCKAASSETVEIRQVLSLLAPNAFSPNNDGKNDTWMPAKLADETYKIFELVIYDGRTKQPVFTSKNAQNRWDGKILNRSVPAKGGETFVWTAKVLVEEGIYKNYQGAIVITDN